MKGKIIGIVVVILALVAGIGGAYAVSRLVPASPVFTRNDQRLPQFGNEFPRGGMGRQGYRGMMPGYGYNQPLPENAARLTIDEIKAAADKYAASVASNLKVTEVMEFSNNFYVVVQETDTGKAAFELLADPYTGALSQEIGANMMWNQKYGMMGSITANPPAVNPISMADAVTKAQAALDARTNGAVVQPDGKDFYGYYSFDYEINGKVAGMLSVNGDTGQVLFHFWHDTFIDEKEFD
jgi:hypothetical protein